MLGVVVAAVLWSAPGPVEVAPGSRVTLTLPPVTRSARLHLAPRLAAPWPQGSVPALRIVVNDVALGTMADRRTPRLHGVGPRVDGLPRFEAGRWRVRFRPVAAADDRLALDVGDVLRADAPNVLRLELAAAAAPLHVDELRLDDDGAALPTREPPPDWGRPRLRPLAPTAFGADADPQRLDVVWPRGGARVRTTVDAPADVHRTRTLVVRPTHVEVHDAFVNAGAALAAIRVRHAVAGEAAWVHVAGSPDPSVTEVYAPWNPTVFMPAGAGGIGLVAEDDVFRQQVVADFADGAAGLRTDLLCLAPGDAYTMVWSVWPLARGDYWDFVAAVRAAWGSNATIPGAYAWFQPDAILAMPGDALAAALRRQRVGVASMWGAWVDPKDAHRPPRIGFGTSVLDDAFAPLRGRLAAAIRKLHAARPGIRVLPYFDAQRDGTEPPGDERVVRPGGGVERSDFGGRFTPAWGVVPRAGGALGERLAAVARAMDALGGDGLYWDEIDGVDYTRPRLTTARWDGRSCVGDGRVGLANLLSDDWKVALARDRFVLGNGPPTTRRLQAGALRIVEMHHGRDWDVFAHLSSPLGYLGGARDWAAVTALLARGLLPAGTRLDYAWQLGGRLFPFTPEAIRPGTLRGRERIVTLRSGTHGWARDTGAVRAFRFDAAGREHRARWPVRYRDGGAWVRVELAPHEVAVIERRASPLAE
jgi:hypothetical protein